ncbi:unnamed protein product [Peronospora belbahrii]|nr:unnamed protein product [Peronospora belbahrii]
MMVQHPFHNFQVSPGLVTTITPAVNLSDIMSLGDLNMFLAPSGNPIDLIKQHIMPPRLLAGVINVKDLTLNELRPHFNKPMTVVAKELGVCITLMKKICRRNGLVRWPHRRIRSLVNRITSLQVLESKADGAERKRFQGQITGLREELSAVIQNPNEKSRKAQISIHKIPANADQSVSQAIKQEYAVAETVFDMVGITDNGDDAKRWMRKMTNVAMKADSKEEFDVTGRALIQKPTRGAETCTKKRKPSLNLHIYQPPSIKIPRHDELPSMYRLRSHSVPERKLRGGQRSGWGRDTADSTSFLCARPSTTTHRSGRRGSISSILNDILE